MTDGGKWLTFHPALEPEQRPSPPCMRVASPLSVTRAGSSCYALDDEGDDATQLFFLCVCGVCVPRRADVLRSLLRFRQTEERRGEGFQG